MSERSPLIRFAAAGVATRRLLCAPYAGGGPAIYRLWPKSLPDDVEVVAIQLPGRDPRSTRAPLDSIAEIVDEIAAAVIAQQEADPLPFAVFGHSMGALIAYELTVALEQSGGTSPQRVFVSSRRAPDENHTGPMISALPEQAFLDRMQEFYGGVPDVIRNEPDLLAMLLPALRADVRAFETYSPLTALPVVCPLHVYGGAADTRPRPSQLTGWQRFASRPITVQLFEGDHFYLNSTRDALTADIGARWIESASPLGRL